MNCYNEKHYKTILKNKAKESKRKLLRTIPKCKILVLVEMKLFFS